MYKSQSYVVNVSVNDFINQNVFLLFSSPYFEGCASTHLPCQCWWSGGSDACLQGRCRISQWVRKRCRHWLGKKCLIQILHDSACPFWMNTMLYALHRENTIVWWLHECVKFRFTTEICAPLKFYICVIQILSIWGLNCDPFRDTNIPYASKMQNLFYELHEICFKLIAKISVDVLVKFIKIFCGSITSITAWHSSDDSWV